MKKHFILLHLKAPDFSGGKTAPKFKEEWDSAKSVLIHTAKNTKGVIELGETAWLIQRDTGLPFVAECISAAQRFNEVTYETWFLDQSE